MKLGIKGHKTRGKEVIEMLKILGGKNSNKLVGFDDKFFYYISDKIICSSYIGSDEIKGYTIFSLEDFLEKFPHKIGDKVICYNEQVSSITSMKWDSVISDIVYILDNGLHASSSNMKPIINVNDDEHQIDYAEIVKKSYEDEVGKMCAEITMDTIVKTVTTFEYLKDRGYDLQEGYHFIDENGNVINAKQIRLVKNAPSYPKTYEECCDKLEFKGGFREIFLSENEYSLYTSFIKLIRCRDAYWKIAGEYMELGKAWEPDWKNGEQKKYCIYYDTGIIQKGAWSNHNSILAFPTIEMRDTFYENFKNLIEKCKELL